MKWVAATRSLECIAPARPLDCFCGSGTTAAVAEKLGRRWIACDLSRFAVHTTRKRLLSIPGVRPFEVQNLGKYERQLRAGAEFGDNALPLHSGGSAGAAGEGGDAPSIFIALWRGWRSRWMGRRTNAAGQVRHDEHRDSWLAQQGVTVLRVRATDVLRDERLEAVLLAIEQAAGAAPSGTARHLSRIAGEEPHNGAKPQIQPGPTLDAGGARQYGTAGPGDPAR